MYLLYNRYVGTDFNKSSGNSKEDTFKSSSTIKGVDQESIRQRNSKPISRETQSNHHKHSKSVGKKKSWRIWQGVVEKKQKRKVYFITSLENFYGDPNESRETQLHLSLSPRLLGQKCRGRMDGSDCMKPFPYSLRSRWAKGLNGLKIRRQMEK